MLKKLLKLVDTRHMLKSEMIKGEIPSTKTAFLNAYELAWPAVVETAFVSLVSFVNTIMVSSLGASAISAVGLTNQPRFIVLAVFVSLNVGVIATISRRKGEGRKEDANAVLRQSLLITILLSVVLSVLAIIFARPFLLLAGANNDTIKFSTTYFVIMMAGFLFTSLSLAITSAQRGVGNTKLSLYTNLSANVVNIIVCYLLIEGKFGFPALGVAGAAIGLVSGSLVGMIIALFSLFKKDSFLYLNLKKSFKPTLEILSPVVKIGSNSVLEQMVMRAGFFVFALMVARLGTEQFAAHQIGMQMLNLSFSLADGLSVAATTLIGQNLGCCRPDLSLIYGKVCQRIAVLFSLMLSFVFIFGGRFLFSLFTDEPQIISLGINIMRIAAISTLLQMSMVVFTGGLRGAGDTKFVAWTMLVAVAVVRPIVAFVLIYTLGYGLIGAWVAVLCDQAVRLYMVYRRFENGKWSLLTI